MGGGGPGGGPGGAGHSVLWYLTDGHQDNYTYYYFMLSQPITTTTRQLATSLRQLLEYFMLSQPTTTTRQLATRYGNPNVTKISKSKLNCAIVQGYWTAANSTMQKYKGRGCCKLNCAKVQRSWMLPAQLCKSTKVLDAAISTVQSRHFNWYGH